MSIGSIPLSPARRRPSQRALVRLNLAMRRLLGAELETVVKAALAVAAVAMADPSPSSLIIGGLLSVLGQSLRIVTAGYGVAAGEMARCGPYRFVRHPYFLGSLLFYVGIGLASRQPWVMALGIVVFAVLYRGRMAADDQRLKERYGAPFSDYAMTVPSLLPRPLPAPRVAGDGRRFSLRLALVNGRHRELIPLFILALVFLVLFLSYELAAKELFGLAVVITVSMFTAGRIFFVWRTGRRTAR